jgi:hypothetical protein
MERIEMVWGWVVNAAVILLKACVWLYVVRCVVSFRIVSFDQFGHFLQVLVSYIFG